MRAECAPSGCQAARRSVASAGGAGYEESGFCLGEGRLLALSGFGHERTLNCGRPRFHSCQPEIQPLVRPCSTRANRSSWSKHRHDLAIPGRCGCRSPIRASASQSCGAGCGRCRFRQLGSRHCPLDRALNGLLVDVMAPNDAAARVD